MSQYDEINSIGYVDKQDMIEVYMGLIDEPLSVDEDSQGYDKAVKSVEQHFHVMTGHNVSLDEIEWYVSQWRGY